MTAQVTSQRQALAGPGTALAGGPGEAPAGGRSLPPRAGPGAERASAHVPGLADERPPAHAASAPRRLGPLAIVWRVIAWTLIVAVAGIVTAGAIVPRVIHAVPLTVLTGSMRPHYNPGDLLIVQPVTSADGIEVGDVITFQPVSNDPALITHRVVAVTTSQGHVTSLVTRGDANGADDKPIVAAQVQGTLAYAIPKVGWFANWMNGGRAWFITIAIVSLFGYAAYSLARGGIEASRRRQQ